MTRPQRRAAGRRAMAPAAVPSAPGRVLEASELAGDSAVVAPRLLNKVLVHGRCSGRIVEVESYRGADDPGSHAFRGRTRRNATMFGRPGLLYVYFTYGMHWCANVVCGEEGWPHAVLLRALAPLEGLGLMREARPAARNDRELGNGPAKLCQALGLDGSFDGADLLAGDHDVWLLDDGMPPPKRPGRGVRVGLSAGADLPLRWWVPGDGHVSVWRPPSRGTRARPAVEASPAR